MLALVLVILMLVVFGLTQQPKTIEEYRRGRYGRNRGMGRGRGGYGHRRHRPYRSSWFPYNPWYGYGSGYGYGYGSGYGSGSRYPYYW